ncbi:NADPH-dependent F420 reductase [Actinocorallia lasiicapitis]
MDVAVVGTGHVGRTLGEALTDSGHLVRYGSRIPEDAIKSALDGSEAVIIAIPGAAVADFLREHGTLLADKIVIDATNKPGTDGPAHSAAEFAILAPSAQYVRAFNTLSWRNLTDPDGATPLLFSCAPSATETVARLIRDTGRTPVPLGEAQYDLLDRLLDTWTALT